MTNQAQPAHDSYGIAYAKGTNLKGYTDFDFQIVDETPKAIMVEIHKGVTSLGNPFRTWLPKSQCRWIKDPNGIYGPSLCVRSWLISANNLWWAIN